MENSTGSLLILLECQFAIDLDPTLLPSKIRKNGGSFTGLPLQKLVRACARRDSLTTLGGVGGAGTGMALHRSGLLVHPPGLKIHQGT